MTTLHCSVTGCDRDAAKDIWTDDDTREWLCQHHADMAAASDWITFPVNGRVLMMDTCGTWWYMPERDEALAELARVMVVES